MIGRKLRIARIVISVLVLGMLTCGALCSALVIPAVEKWLCRIQIGPAVVTFTLHIFFEWALVTLLFGRIYCSTVCPLGTMQDIAARLTRRRPLAKFGTMRNRYSYARPAAALRLTVLVVVAFCLLANILLLPKLLEPFTAFESICHDLLLPAIAFAARGLVAVGIDSRPAASVVVCSTAATTLSAMLALSVTVVSMRSGRTICNTVCPVGTALGCFSRYSIYQMDIDTDLCINCGLCEDVCKASCIDLTDHVVDGSRCVVCFDCTAVCPAGAIRYTRRRKQLATPMMQKIAGLGRQPEASVDCSELKTIKPTNINETISDSAPRHP